MLHTKLTGMVTKSGWQRAGCGLYESGFQIPDTSSPHFMNFEGSHGRKIDSLVFYVTWVHKLRPSDDVNMFGCSTKNPKNSVLCGFCVISTSRWPDLPCKRHGANPRESKDGPVGCGPWSANRPTGELMGPFNTFRINRDFVYLAGAAVCKPKQEKRWLWRRGSWKKWLSS